MPAPVDPVSTQPPTPLGPQAPASPPAGPNTYDAVPYLSFPFVQSHPDRIATVASLFGLLPARADSCRLLELGCASGGNLIPLALNLPGSRFLGVDLSERQIAVGRQTVEALGLKNIELRQASILDVDDSYGQFDYIVAHGIYSWVPDEVKDKILEINARLLRPDGVGYVSYNTYPGWRVRGILRDLMFYHLDRFPDAGPREQISRARAVVEFLGKPNNPFGTVMRQELELFRNLPDATVYHNHLEEHNDPVYFCEFVERLTARGLRYLGDAEPGTMIPWDFPAEIQQLLDGAAADQVQVEQYLDFLRNRAFRQTLVCHPHHQPNYNLRSDRVTALHVASPLKPVSPKPDLNSAAPERFAGPGNLEIQATEPIVKAALVSLAEAWPHTLPFDQLFLRARVRLTPGPYYDPEKVRKDGATLSQTLLTAFIRNAVGLVELWECPPRCVLAGDRPAASPLARWQAFSGPQATNQRHQVVPLADLDRHLLALLDGNRDRPALLAGLLQRFREGALAIAHQGAKVSDESTAGRLLAQAIDQQLPRLAANSLLVS